MVVSTGLAQYRSLALLTRLGISASMTVLFAKNRHSWQADYRCYSANDSILTGQWRSHMPGRLLFKVSPRLHWSEGSCNTPRLGSKGMSSWWICLHQCWYNYFVHLHFVLCINWTASWRCILCSYGGDFWGDLLLVAPDIWFMLQAVSGS